MENTMQRDAYWDVVKGVLILLVVMGHVVQYGVGGDFWHNPVFKGIYIFHMPLFMLVSGYFSWNGLHRGAGWLLSRTRQLILPNVVFTFVLVGFALLWAYDVRDGGRMLEQYRRNCNPPFWYLCVLFECSVFGWLLFRSPKLWWRILWVLLPVGYALLLPYGVKEWQWSRDVLFLLPWGKHFPAMWPYFLLGLCLRRVGISGASSISHLWLVCVPLAILSWYFFRKEDYIYITPLTPDVASWLPTLYRFIAGLLCSFACLYLLKLLLPLLQRQRWLLALGKATMAIYMLQQMFLLMRGTAKLQQSFSHVGSSLWAMTAAVIVATALVTAACYLIYALGRRSRWCALLFFGEKLPPR